MKLGGVIFTSWKDLAAGNYKSILIFVAALYALN